MFKSSGKLHWIKNLYLRWRYGGGCCDIYGLDYYLAKKILPPLKEFRHSIKHNGGGYPADITHEKWIEQLDEMIWAFDFLINGEELTDDMEQDKKNWQRQRDGFKLFGERFRDLWI